MSKNAKMTNPMKVITGPNTRLSNNLKIQSDVRYFLSSIFFIPFLSLFFT